MLINKIFIPAITILSFGMSSTNAENTGVIFPPAGSVPSYNTPSQTQSNSAGMPSYSFGQPTGSQLPTAPVNMNRFTPNQTSNQPPFPMKNNQYPAFQGNNNSGLPFSNNNMMPFGNNNSNYNPFSNNSMPFFGNGNNNSMPFFGNGNNSSMPFFGNTNNNRKKAWGTERNIWPDFYTDFTDEAWDTVTSAPRDLGTMPGGWRFPHISTPDPVTVSDAITNQFPPIMEEGGNMMDFSDWGVFD